MSLIVEDGSNVPGAESYQTVAGADNYHSKRGNTVWATLITSVKEQCLRNGTDYMRGAYRARWKGYRFSATQDLDWPRSWVYLEPFVHGAVGTYPYLVADNIVPNEVKDACSWLALKSYLAELAPDIERLVASESVGPTSTTYITGAVPYTVYRAIDLMLKPFLQSSGGIKMVRA